MATGRTNVHSPESETSMAGRPGHGLIYRSSRRLSLQLYMCLHGQPWSPCVFACQYYMCLHGQPWSWYACKHAAPQLSGRGLTDFWFTMYQVITSKTAPVCLLVSTTCVCTASRGRGTHVNTQLLNCLAEA
ncbi:hypothetical protein J6590_055268 [Homalodisca vitripennis]|nr:hypothetical protein J6590_055268 [Homalodisca vitripennis]